MTGRQRYRVAAHLQAPLVARRSRQSQRSESLTTLPGTAVRGALAQLYLQQEGEADTAFARLFLGEEACRFGPLDPDPQLLPLTAVVCKRYGEDHGLDDQLWLRMARQVADPQQAPETWHPWERCRSCNHDLKAQVGFVKKAELLQTVVAHVGIDRYTTTAAHQIFYTLEALEPTWENSGKQADLVGWLETDETNLATLQRVLAAEDDCIFVGHARTRGYGRLRLRLDLDPVHPDPAVWVEWSRRLAEFLKPWAGSELGESDFFFSVSLPTGAILVDPLLRYALDLSAWVSWLPPLPLPTDGLRPGERSGLPFGSGQLRFLTAVTRHERLRGWNAAHGLPRQDEWVVSRGAVYAYWFHGNPTDRAALVERLQELEQVGVGLRRQEGFGIVTVSDPFHADYVKQRRNA